jgi:hypothetical protein
MPVTVTPVITIEQPPIETVVRPRARIEAPVVGAPADVAGPPPVDTTTRREAVRPREERREREEERRELRAARRDKGKPERGREVVTAGPARTRRGVEVGAVVKIPDPVSVRGLADALQLDTSDILRELLVRGAHSNINASISGEIARPTYPPSTRWSRPWSTGPRSASRALRRTRFASACLVLRS